MFIPARNQCFYCEFVDGGKKAELSERARAFRENEDAINRFGNESLEIAQILVRLIGFFCNFFERNFSNNWLNCNRRIVF